MRLTPLAAALALTLGLTFAVAAPAAARGPAQASAPQGVSVAAARDWIRGLGGEVGEIERDNGQVFFSIQDGGLTWFLIFNGCRADAACGDAQFMSSFTNAEVTLDKVNAWNRDQRFLKAHFEPASAGGEPTAMVQFDLILTPGQDVDQMTDALAVWVASSRAFATHIGYLPAQ